MRPCARGCPKFRASMQRARGECVPARAGSQCLGHICAARAGNSPLRTRMPEVAALYETRARGMRPCVRGSPKFRLCMQGARVECVPACADSQSFGPICNARAGNESLRVRAANVSALYAQRARRMRPCLRGRPKFRPYIQRARGECVHACADSQSFGPICNARGEYGPACAGSQCNGPICNARAGNAPLRARTPKVSSLYATRAREMRP